MFTSCLSAGGETHPCHFGYSIFPSRARRLPKSPARPFMRKMQARSLAELLRMADLLGAGAGNLRPALFSDENQPGDPTVASGKCRSRKQ